MITNPAIEEYLTNLSQVPHPILSEMEEEAKAVNFPIVGPLVGRLLYLLIEYGHVHTVLECGSGFGYSALWLALALPENGHITCIEYSEKNIQRAKGYFEKAGLSHKVTFVQGNAVELLPGIRETFDLVVNDVDKIQYPEIFPHLLSHLRVGGLLITDNLLWHGKVVEQEVDEQTKAILTYNRLLFDEPQLFTTILPLRDGIGLSIKLTGREI